MPLIFYSESMTTYTLYLSMKKLNFDNLKVGLILINAENEAHTYSKLKKTKCPVVMGHLELSGFMANQNHVMEHGADRNPYKKFDKVFSLGIIIIAALRQHSLSW